MERALGRISIDEQEILQIVARGTHLMEQFTFLPKLPSGVSVRSVHDDPISRSKIYILESDAPIEGWTQFVEPGREIPLSSVAMEKKGQVVNNAKDPEYWYRNMTLEQFLSSVRWDKVNNVAGFHMRMTIEDYLRHFIAATE
jgi:hypothetical protein